MCACRGGWGVCEALGVGGGGTRKEGSRVRLGKRVWEASPRAVGRPSARPCAPPRSRLLSPGAPPRARRRLRPHPTWLGGRERGRVSRPRSGRGVPQLETCLYLLLSTPCAWSCRFQEEELRGTSLGSGAARGARLSSAPPLLALPCLPWLSRSLERLQRTGGREVSWPQSRRTPPPDLGAAPACFAASTREEGAWERKTPTFSLFSTFGNIKKCLRFSVAEIKRLEGFWKFKRIALSRCSMHYYLAFWSSPTTHPTPPPPWICYPF